jgi:hypothetical protein
MDYTHLIQRTRERVVSLKQFLEVTDWSTSKTYKKSIEASLELNETLLKVLFEQYASSCNIKVKELSSNQLGF